MGTSEENTHYILVSIGVAHLSKNGSFRFLNEKMADLISKFKLMETCELIKHSAVGHKSQICFSVLGGKT